ncbi:MAG: restriction endonuclease subunit S [Anaerolineae bacterium]|nr:restriction endonuclease subunit S [Anaerolineae bacterium]
MIDKSHWPRVRFGDVVRQVKDKVDPKSSGLKRYIAGEHMDTDDLRIRRWGEIGDDYLGPAFHMRFKPGQVLYGSRRTYLRKVAVPDFEGITANTTFVLESKDPKVLLPELLPFIMQTERFNDHSVKQSKGSVNPYVNFSDLAWYEFALPPLEEQRRIAEVLEAIENTIEAYCGANLRLARLVTSYVENSINSADHYCVLGDLLSDTSYGSSSRSTYEPLGFPILRIPNILRGKLDLSDLQWLQLEQKDASRYLLESGDILIVRTNGNPDYVGRCVVVPPLETQMVYASYLIRLRVKKGNALPEFVAAMLNSPSIRRRLRGDVRSSAGNYNLNTAGIKRQKIPFPPYHQQIELVDNATRLTDVENKIVLRLQAADDLKHSVLTLLEQ